MLSGEGIKHKKELCHRVPFYGFPIGTISKVKKIVLGLRYKGRAKLTVCQIFFYVIRHTFLACFGCISSVLQLYLLIVSILAILGRK